MKKIIVLLLLALSLFSTAFSSGKTSQEASPQTEAFFNEMGRVFRECQLKPPRWVYLTTLDEQVNKILFYDEQSIVSPYPYAQDVWVGVFYRGKSPCAYPECKEKAKPHYHLSRWRLDSRLMQFTVLSVATRDENYNVVDSADIPSYLQKAKTIAPDTVGEQLLNEIKGVKKETSSEKANRFDVPRIEPPTAEKSVYQIGDKGWKIKQAQQYLLKLGFDPGEADGIFSKSTRIAIRKFQERYNLKETGNLDNATYEELKWQAEAKDYKKK